MDRERPIILGRHHLHGTFATLGPVDRLRHLYCVGKTGTGKSTFQYNMIVQDLLAGRGVCLIDPHGRTAEQVLRHFPRWRARHLTYLNPADPTHSVGINPLDVPAKQRALATAHVVSIFKARWIDNWGPSLERVLANSVAALMHTPGSTFLGVQRLLRDKDYRERVVARVRDPVVRDFWTKEFAGWTPGQRSEKTAPVLNKIDPFLADPATRHIFGQSRSSFDLRFMMDHERVLIANLASGAIGEDNANLIGAFLISKLFLTAMSRAKVLEENLEASDEEIAREMEAYPNFYLFVDEFQSFSSSSFIRILSEARKFHLSLTLAHQYIDQVPEEIQAAVFGNVGSLAVFRVGRRDAERLAPELDGENNVMPGHLTGLESYQAYAKLLRDDEEMQAFRVATYAPYESGRKGRQKMLITRSRTRFAEPRETIEARIGRWFENGSAAPPSRPTPRKRYRPEEIVRLLHRADVSLAAGKTLAQVVKPLGISEATFAAWRDTYGGLSELEAARLKELQKENAGLRRAVMSLTLDKLLLEQTAKGETSSEPS